MEGGGDDLLAGARLALNEHGSLHVGNAPHKLHDGPHLGGAGHQLLPRLFLLAVPVRGDGQLQAGLIQGGGAAHPAGEAGQLLIDGDDVFDLAVLVKDRDGGDELAVGALLGLDGLVEGHRLLFVLHKLGGGGLEVAPGEDGVADHLVPGDAGHGDHGVVDKEDGALAVKNIDAHVQLVVQRDDGRRVQMFKHGRALLSCVVLPAPVRHGPPARRARRRTPRRGWSR